MGSRMGSNGGIDDRSCLPPLPASCLPPLSAFSACLLPVSSACLLPAAVGEYCLCQRVKPIGDPKTPFASEGDFVEALKASASIFSSNPMPPSPPLGATFPLAALLTLLMRVVSLCRAGSPCCDDVRDEGEAEH